MKPLLSILLALIISILLTSLIYIVESCSTETTGALLGGAIYFITFFGGLIATWFSIEDKSRYGLYYGLIFSGMFAFLAIFFEYWIFLVKYSFFFSITPIIGLCGGIIAKNEKINTKSLYANKFQINYKNFFMNLYKRNKIVLIVSLTIFMVSLFIGGLSSFHSGPFNQYVTNLIVHYLSSLMVKKVGTGSIFLNNITYSLIYLYIDGIFFGIQSTLSLIVSGLILGFQFFKYPFIVFYLLPHGIFELTSYVIATAAGYKLLSTILNIIWKGLQINRDLPLLNQINLILSINYIKFRDSLILFGIAVVLLFIAAIIEANFSIPFGNYITGLGIHSFPKYMLSLINYP